MATRRKAKAARKSQANPPCERCGKRHRKVLPSEERWIDEYIVHLNATRATEMTRGDTVSKGSLRRVGSEILHRPAVQCAVSAALGEQRKRTQIRADEVLQDLAAIARFDLAEVIDANDQVLPVRQWPAWARRIVASWKVDKEGNVTLGFPDRLRAYEMLGRHHRLFKDVLQVGGELTLRDRMSQGRRAAAKRRQAEGD